MKYDLDQLCKGLKVELEHTDDPMIAVKIAMDHLDEIPNYYDLLLEMEKQAKGSSVDPSLRPPSKWFKKMEKSMVEKGVKGDLIPKIIGQIWYHNLSDKRRKEIREREGKQYGPAK